MIRMSCLAFLLVVTQAAAQTPTESNKERRAGVGVDYQGGQTIDPTRNVLDLVRAAIERQDDLRAAQEKLNDAKLQSVSDISALHDKMADALRDAETRRLNELATQKQVFDLELARVLRAGLDASTLLLATQLKEVKTDLSDRTAKLEQFRWEAGGRQTYQDPAALLLQKQVDLLTQATLSRAGQDKGIGDVVGYIIAGIMLLIALVGVVVAVITVVMRRESARVTQAISSKRDNLDND